MGQLLATLRKSDNKRAAELFLDFESMSRGVVRPQAVLYRGITVSL
jgi:hypothetical protein